MITLIIVIISLIFSITGLVITFKDESDKDTILFSVFTAILVTISIFILGSGKSIYKQDTTNLLNEKAQIEYLLENNLDGTAVKMAKNYNENIEFGNNYWCRFNIEDRSEFIINIEKYYEKETETPVVKQKIAHLEKAYAGNYMNFSCNTTVVVYESSILINKNGSRVEYILFQDDSGIYYNSLDENFGRIYLSFGIVYVDQGDHTYKNVTTVTFENTIYSRYELI